MPGIIAASEAAQEDMAMTSETVAAALNVFGMEAKESSHIADVYFLNQPINLLQVSWICSTALNMQHQLRKCLVYPLRNYLLLLVS